MSARRSDDDDFDEKSYVRVHERLSEFRESNPQGLISTFRTREKNGVVFRTVVCRDKTEAELFGLTGIAAADGHAYLDDEEYGEKMEEFAETVSVGRALAKLGLKVKNGIASAEEMNQFRRKTEGSSAETSEEGSEEGTEEQQQSEASEPAGETKLRSSRRFSGKSSSRFG